jgi:hygromycin-B 7''-O-kinase
MAPTVLRQDNASTSHDNDCMGIPEPMLFPLADTVERYLAIRGDEARLRPAVTALCDHLGLRASGVVRLTDGSMPVYAVGGSVLKLYPPVFRNSCPVERRVLQAIQGRLPIRTPGVRHAGDFGGWNYLLIERLHGQPLTEVWEHLTAPQRHRLASQLGEALAALHAFTAPELDDLAPAEWERFLAEQRAGCVDHQRVAGLESAWLAQIPAFMDLVSLDGSPAPPRPALLHTEVMNEHLLVAPGSDGWSLSGMVDFESAMRGATEYEFAAVGLFVSRGDADFLRSLLLAYGYGPERLDDALPRRLLAYALLHRYSNLRWWLEQLPPPPAPTLDALAAHWWRVR